MSGAVWRQILGVSCWNCIVMAGLILFGRAALDLDDNVAWAMPDKDFVAAVDDEVPSAEEVAWT